MSNNGTFLGRTGGQANYEAHRDAIPEGGLESKQPFDQLPYRVQQAWEAGARASVAHDKEHVNAFDKDPKAEAQKAHPTAVGGAAAEFALRDQVRSPTGFVQADGTPALPDPAPMPEVLQEQAPQVDGETDKDDPKADAEAKAKAKAAKKGK